MIARQLADWAAGLGHSDIPAEVRHEAARHLMDGVGNAIAARYFGDGDAGLTVARELGGPPQAHPLGDRTAISAPAAAFAGGVLMHALDFDDTHAGALVHPTVVVAPTALAVGEQLASSGTEVLSAVTVGLEVACRIGAAAPHAFHARGLHATGMVGPLASAITAARLHLFSGARTAHALGIAGSSSSGLLEFLETGDNTKIIHPGSANLNGILAVRLAAQGVTGPASVLEGPRGLFAALAGRAPDADALIGDLGTTWQAGNIGIKPYPSCQLMHVSLDAVAAALVDRPVDPGAVESIVLHVHPDSAPIVCPPEAGKRLPRTIYDAKFDLPWSAASLLHDGSVTLGTYSDTAITRTDVLQTAAKVIVQVTEATGPAADAPGHAEIRLADGSTLIGDVAGSRGTTAVPISDADLIAKFVQNCGNHPAAHELAEFLLHLDDAPSLHTLTTSAADIVIDRR